MLRQKTGPATMAGNKTSASSPSWSCSLTRCSAEPVPAASATLRPKGCHVPSARPARRSRKFASNSGWPSISCASPPSGRWTVRGARSRYFSGTRCTHRSGGTSRCPSLDIRLYCRAIYSSFHGEPPLTPPLSPQAGRGRAPRQWEGEGQWPVKVTTLQARTVPMRRGPGSSPGSRRSRCTLLPAPRTGAAAPAALAGSPIPDRPRGRGHRSCRSRSRSAPSLDAANLMQEVAQRVLDRLLRFRCRAEKIDLELAFHEVHQLFVALAQMLVSDERVINPIEIGHDTDAGVCFLIIVLGGAGQRMDVREHHRHAEIGGQGLSVGLRDVHQLALVLDPAFAEQHVGVQFAVLAFVPDLAGAHALQIDVALLVGDVDRQ